jgi:phenylpropionate dioxygenase-like ring-hydroxylating dioxygenase large terminal subunit
VCEGAGNRTELVCPNHGWTYGLDGSLRHVPDFEGVAEFNAAENGLYPVKADTWGQVVFVNLDAQAEPLLSYIGGMADKLAPYSHNSLTPTKGMEYTYPSNWKLVYEGFCEANHIPYVHGFLQEGNLKSDI